MNARTLENVVCGACECVCDDLTVQVANQRIIAGANACPKAIDWFHVHSTTTPPVAMIDGVACPFDQAIQRAVTLLNAAKAPLIYGLLNASMPGVRAAIALAEKLGGTIDPAVAPASVRAMQDVGMVTATLGEVKHRADTIIFWACDPVSTHPRLFERVIVNAPGRPTRRIIVVDVEATATAKVADEFIRIEPHQHFEAFTVLRQILAGIRAESPWMPLAQAAMNSRWGMVFFGGDMANGTVAHRTVAALLQWVRELNDGRRFYAKGLNNHGDISGTADILTWQTGYAAAVDFAAGYPQSYPGVSDGPARLSRNEVDTAVIVGPECVERLPTAARAHLRSIAAIVLRAPGESLDWCPSVTFTTAVPGIHTPSTAHRLDGISLPMPTLVNCEWPTDAAVIGAMTR